MSLGKRQSPCRVAGTGRDAPGGAQYEQYRFPPPAAAAPVNPAFTYCHW